MRKSVCVFCASSNHLADVYLETAAKLGRCCAQQGIRIVNGAGRVGLMGAVSDACLEAGGEVMGVIPQFMVDNGWCHEKLSQLIVTEDMAERKRIMRLSSEAIIVIPGGCGTMEEFFEVVTLRQLGLYVHPIILLNVNGFFSPIMDFWKKLVEEHFLQKDCRDLITVAESVEECMQLLQSLPEKSYLKKN